MVLRFLTIFVAQFINLKVNDTCHSQFIDTFSALR